MVHNYGGFKPVVGDRYSYTNDVGYLADGTPISTAGNNSLPNHMATSYSPPAPVAPPPVAPPVPAVAPPVAAPVATPVPTAYTGEPFYGIKFDYAMQKDAYADLQFLNDVGFLAENRPF